MQERKKERKKRETEIKMKETENCSNTRGLWGCSRAHCVRGNFFKKGKRGRNLKGRGDVTQLICWSTCIFKNKLGSNGVTIQSKQEAKSCMPGPDNPVREDTTDTNRSGEITQK